MASILDFFRGLDWNLLATFGGWLALCVVEGLRLWNARKARDKNDDTHNMLADFVKMLAEIKNEIATKQEDLLQGFRSEVIDLVDREKEKGQADILKILEQIKVDASARKKAELALIMSRFQELEERIAVHRSHISRVERARQQLNEGADVDIIAKELRMNGSEVGSSAIATLGISTALGVGVAVLASPLGIFGPIGIFGATALGRLASGLYADVYVQNKRRNQFGDWLAEMHKKIAHDLRAIEVEKREVQTKVKSIESELSALTVPAAR